MTNVVTYFVSDVWVVANGAGWVPGRYDTEATARLAGTEYDARVHLLQHIWRVDGQDRPLTEADLRTLDHQPAS